MPKSQNIRERQKTRKTQILNIVRQNPSASRAMIQKEAHISMESALALVDELLAQGLLLECGKDDTPVGRKPMLLRINPDGCYYMGIRFNARCINGVVMDYSMTTIARERIALPDNVDTSQIIRQLEVCIAALLEHLGGKAARLRGIGIGTPGIIDLPHGVVKRYVHISDWFNVPLKQLLEAHFSYPVLIERGIQCTARSFHALPAYREYKNIVFVQISRGVHMGMILGGQLYDGGTDTSGEIGHICVQPDGLPCACGRKGCLETLISNPVILSNVCAGMTGGRFQTLSAMLTEGCELTVHTVVEAASRGDRDCESLLRQAGGYAGKALSPVVTLLNPDCLILSGGIAPGEAFQTGLKQAVQQESLTECLNALRLCFEPENDLFDAMGAAQLCLSRHLELDEA